MQRLAGRGRATTRKPLAWTGDLSLDRVLNLETLARISSFVSKIEKH